MHVLYYIFNRPEYFFNISRDAIASIESYIILSIHVNENYTKHKVIITKDLLKRSVNQFVAVHICLPKTFL